RGCTSDCTGWCSHAWTRPGSWRTAIRRSAFPRTGPCRRSGRRPTTWPPWPGARAGPDAQPPTMAAMHTDPHPALDTGLAELGLDPALAAPLRRYLDLLARWNRTYNLTAIRDPREMVTLHLLDSLSMHAHVRGIARLADLGTGAGLPGIPLAIALPALQVTLVESNGKKARFLREAVRTLGLANAQVAESRAEAVDMPGAFDAITARAMATLADILAVGGHLLA